MGIINSDFQRY